MWHKPCRTFHPWCPCIKTRCLFSLWCNCWRIICHDDHFTDLHDYVIKCKDFLLYWPFVTGGFPSQRPVTRRTFDVFFDLRTVGQTIETLVIWDAIALIVMSYLGLLITVFIFMMTSSNGNIFRVTGHLCGEFTGPRWIPRTKASDADLWWFLWSASE